jgi:acyl-CoA thioesterase-1
MRSLSFAVLLCAVLNMLQSTVQAQEYQVIDPKNPAYCKVIDDPKLPRVLIIGDSISIGYTHDVQKQLVGVANVHRIKENGGPTTNGIKKIDQWIGDSKWDVIHFNWGLHDIKYMNEKGELINDIKSGKQQVSAEDYEKNLNALVERLEKTGAKLIWRNTTPVPEGAGGRVTGDEVKYNDIAAKIMKAHNIPTDDMYGYCMPHLKEWQMPKNVHFTAKGSKKLAEDAVAHIKVALGTK